eukprot:gene12650-3357_t
MIYHSIFNTIRYSGFRIPDSIFRIPYSGFRISYSGFRVLKEEFDASNASIALASSIPSSLLFMFATVAVIISDRIGFRLSIFLGGMSIGVALLMSSFTSNIIIIYLTLGVLYAFGQSLCYHGSLLILSLYFEKNLSFAHGIVLSGSNLGGLAQSPIVGYILKHNGFSEGIRLCSVIALFIIPMSVIFKRPGESFGFNRWSCVENAKRNDTAIGSKYLPLHKNKAYMIFILSTMFWQFGINIDYVHIVRLALDKAVPYTEATFLPGLTSIAQFIGKIAFGKLSSMKAASNLALCQISTAFMGVLMFLPFLKGFAGLAIISFVFGFAQGMYSASNLIIVREIVGTQQFKRGYNVNQFVTGAAIICSPPLAGYLYTVTGNYILAFLIAGGCAVMGMLLMFLVRYFHSQNEEKNELLLKQLKLEVIAIEEESVNTI